MRRSARVRRTLYAAALALLGGAAAAHPSACQAPPTVSLVTQQGLRFGLLLPGTTEAIDVTDVQRRGEVSLSGEGRIRVLFSLPTELQSSEGLRIPVRFGPDDAALVYAGRPQVHRFDPALGTDAFLTKGRDTLHVLLGGTVEVGWEQPVGSYAGTAVVVVTRPDS